MKTEATPGPWSINDWTQAKTDIAIGAVGTPLIARVMLRDVSINEQKANAHLIAAAPDLLEVARSAAAIGFHWLPDGPCECSRCELVREAISAIAKATGSAA